MKSRKLCIDANILNKLTNKHKELALYIAYMLNPSITKEQIKQSTGVGESTYQKSMRYLKDNGYITFEQEKDLITGEFTMQKIDKKPNKNIEKTQQKTDLKIILKGGRYREITNEELSIYKTAYPSISVEKEIQKMHAWSFSNPEKRKTEKGIRKFINTWLSRASNNNSYTMTDIRRQFETQTNRKLTPAEKCAIGCKKSLEKLQENKGNEYF